MYSVHDLIFLSCWPNNFPVHVETNFKRRNEFFVFLFVRIENEFYRIFSSLSFSKSSSACRYICCAIRQSVCWFSSINERRLIEFECNRFFRTLNIRRTLRIRKTRRFWKKNFRYRRIIRIQLSSFCSRFVLEEKQTDLKFFSTLTVAFRWSHKKISIYQNLIRW